MTLTERNDMQDLCEELDKLADLMADSTEILVRDTPVVERLNDIIARYCPLPNTCEHGVKDGDWREPCNREMKRAVKENGDA